MMPVIYVLIRYSSDINMTTYSSNSYTLAKMYQKVSFQMHSVMGHGIPWYRHLPSHQNALYETTHTIMVSLRYIRCKLLLDQVLPTCLSLTLVSITKEVLLQYSCGSLWYHWGPLEGRNFIFRHFVQAALRPIPDQRTQLKSFILIDVSH